MTRCRQALNRLKQTIIETSGADAERARRLLDLNPQDADAVEIQRRRQERTDAVAAAVKSMVKRLVQSNASPSELAKNVRMIGDTVFDELRAGKNPYIKWSVFERASSTTHPVYSIYGTFSGTDANVPSVVVEIRPPMVKGQDAAVLTFLFYPTSHTHRFEIRDTHSLNAAINSIPNNGTIVYTVTSTFFGGTWHYTSLDDALKRAAEEVYREMPHAQPVKAVPSNVYYIEFMDGRGALPTVIFMEYGRVSRISGSRVNLEDSIRLRVHVSHESIRRANKLVADARRNAVRD